MSVEQLRRNIGWKIKSVRSSFRKASDLLGSICRMQYENEGLSYTFLFWCLQKVFYVKMYKIYIDEFKPVKWFEEIQVYLSLQFRERYKWEEKYIEHLL